jgi:hypothetical protein
LKFLLAVLPAAILLSGCGYHVTGHADTVPAKVKTIAIPTFKNLTVRYRLSEQLPAAITREFISRTHFQIVTDESQADAVLRGAVTNYIAFPYIADQQTGRAAGVQVSVVLNVSLVERATGKVLFNRPYFEFRNRYEISSDEINYFDESQTAMDRLAPEVAKSIVSAVLEGF